MSPALCSVYCLDCEPIGDHGASEDGDDAFTDDVSILGAIEFLNARLVENANVGSDDGVGINHALTNDGIRADIGDFVPSGPLQDFVATDYDDSFKSTFLSITVHGPTMELMILAPSRMTHPSEMIERSVNEDP